MRFGGAVQPVDGLGGDGQRGVVAERDVGAVDVVVDGLGHADDGTFSSDSQCAAVRVPSPPIGISTSMPLSSSVCLIWSSPARSLSGWTRAVPSMVPPLASSRSLRSSLRSWMRRSSSKPAPAVEETDDRRAVAHVAGAHHCPDHRVQARTVTAAGEVPMRISSILPRRRPTFPVTAPLAADRGRSRRPHRRGRAGHRPAQAP